MKWYSQLNISLLTALILAACSTTPTPDAAPVEEPAEAVHLRLLAFNDFHGALEGPTGTMPLDGEDVEVGGAAYLAAHLEAERGEADFTTTLSAGDIIGASPLVSAIFHDEPTIEIMGEAGLDLASVGNHEFDAGVDELMRLVQGGCHPDEGCRAGHEYEGAPFDYLAANVRFRDSGLTILPPYVIRDYGGVKIAYIGMTLEATDQVVVPSAIESVTFHNEVETVEALMPELREQGVNSVIVVVHEGARPTADSHDIHGCPDVEGRAVDMAQQMPEEVSVIVSAHSHLAYICNIEGRLVTQASSSGRLITVIDLHINPATGEIVDKSARQRLTTRDIEPHAGVEALVTKYVALAEPLANRPIGRITGDFLRGERVAAGESPIGRLIADSQLAATAEESGAQIAFMNPGGIRDSLYYEDDALDEDGVVTYAHLHTVQPFGNLLVTMTLRGSQLHQLLEQQWNDPNRPHLLAVSQGFTYDYDLDAPVGERVDPASMRLRGQTIDAEETYRVTVNNFMADGGDGFEILKQGTERTGGPVDVEALADFIERHSPLAPPQDRRARQVE